MASDRAAGLPWAWEEDPGSENQVSGSLHQVLKRTNTITFDCYGTLIDWEAGLRESLLDVFGPAAEAHKDELFRAYVRAEAAVEAANTRSYRDVLATVAKQVARQFDVDLSDERAGRLVELLPHWTPFDDTNDALRRLKRRYRLGVLSNIDRDLFDQTAKHFDVEFDLVITAEDVHAYKPAHLHFHRLINVHEPRESVLHVAQSLYHDGVPAQQIGISFVWINRHGEENHTRAAPIETYPNLRSLADAADELG